MDKDGRVAIVTGAASGIGRALSAALCGRGDTVVLADTDRDGLAAVTNELSVHAGQPVPVELDVRDWPAVDRMVDETFARHGRLDLMFNNAGIGIGGNAEELTLAHWERIIDVNLRGVVHGVQAAYPRMVERGSGHIVNTASLAGLIPGPLLTPYAMTKHAVVGLSLSLRQEAVARGVRVSVVCPGVIDTPILDKGNPEDLPRSPAGIDHHGREYLSRIAGRPYPADRLAADVLRGVDRNRAVIIAPRPTRFVWLMQRLAPGLLAALAVRQVAWARANLMAATGASVSPRRS